MTDADVSDLPPVLVERIESLPVDSIKLHPDNPNVGDIESIIESIRTNGMFKPILVQASTRFALAGNHTLQAAVQLGLARVPAIVLDVDDATALRILLSDNQTARRSADDKDKLAELLVKLADGDGLGGTGYDTGYLDELLEGLSAVDPNAPPGVTGEAVARPRPAQQAAAYEASAIRSIILPLANDVFGETVDKLARLREHLGLEDNAAVFVALVDEAVERLPDGA